ncbi:hypothetical protein [Winogradskyella sp. 3972H.M.0a.05]|uniref:hypothetical protein n=1 Tax=Winogradskyella sp. 3972H.M.0a.05 TaxID=2950277 RepID=UPI003393BA4B
MALCINKDKPELQCNGKCHLAKQLEEQKESSSDSSARIALEQYPIGFVYILKLPKTINTPYKKEDLPTYYNLYSYRYSKSVFHPPSVV